MYQAAPNVAFATGFKAMKTNIIRSLFGVFLLLVSLATVSLSQETTGNLVGTVKDSNGAGVPNATVTITDTAQDVVVRTVQTNDGGDFSIPNVPTTTYSVTVEAANFKKSVQTEVKVDVGARRSVDITLEAGRIDEVVTVTAQMQ